eukprot:TRINITY_DN37688_c0_g1_i1.p1 TRINITY_DN37688_c0_g1~~TRINITY_DN37688_c0_g1_i1.p1  ORF type:complete len:183 (+),score=41.96 TRINITY_DN37688_c0_g1_i1:44-550(+)
MSPATKPRGKYNNAKKQSKSLREIYEEACVEMKVTPNSVLLNTLPNKVGMVLNSDSLDLSRNYVGDRGLVPVLAIVQRSPQLQKLNFSENGLRNNAIKAMVGILKYHPEISSIDVSDNYISEGAGRALESLLKENTRITDLQFNNTKIDVDLRLKLKEQLAANSKLAG